MVVPAVTIGQYVVLIFGRNCEEGVSVASLNYKMAGLAFLFNLGGV